MTSSYSGASFPVAVVAVLLTLPILFGHVGSTPIIPQWTLAVAIAFVFFKSLGSSINLAFVVAALGGMVSLIVANILDPGDTFEIRAFWTNSAELFMWNLFAASFVFLGRELSNQWGLKQIAVWLALSSSVFLIVITVPLLISGAPVRALSHIDSTASVAVNFLNLPIYASFGVNSLVPLFCLQAAVICAGLYVLRRRVIIIVLTMGLVCAIYLIVGSDNRASQLSLMTLIVPLAWLMRDRIRWRRTGLVFAALCVAITLTAMRGAGEHRLVQTVKEMAHSTVALPTAPAENNPAEPTESMKADPEPAETMPPEPESKQAEAVENKQADPTETMPAEAVENMQAEPPAEKMETKTIDSISTGRLTIWRYAFSEWLEHPIVGIGFSTFGRYGNDVPDAVRQNTTAHLYYLNVLWKGGLVFFVPFMTFTGLAMFGAFKRRADGFQIERAFFATACVMAFTFQSVFWDFPMLPSGGSLAWFLLGAMITDESPA